MGYPGLGFAVKNTTLHFTPLNVAREFLKWLELIGTLMLGAVGYPGLGFDIKNTTLRPSQCRSSALMSGTFM